VLKTLSGSGEKDSMDIDLVAPASCGRFRMNGRNRVREWR
jgi:hypothetical protein